MILNTYKKIRCVQMNVPDNHSKTLQVNIPGGLQIWALNGGGCVPDEYTSGDGNRIITSTIVETLFLSSSTLTDNNIKLYDKLSTYYNPYNDASAGWFFRFGSGTTPVQATDTKLESDITYQLSQVRGNLLTTIDENDEMVTTVTMSATNANNTAKTISEIGIAIPIDYQRTGSSYWYRSYAVIIRELLPEPITLEPNKSCNITFEIRGLH